MAVPIILGGVALSSGAYGLYKGVKGAVDHKEASKQNSNALERNKKAVNAVENQRESTSKLLEDYGQRKWRCFDGVIQYFVENFERLKNVELVSSAELHKLKVEDFSNKTLSGLRGDYQALKDAGLGLGAGVSGGAAVAFGAYNGTMMLATASTGTAISSLSGVAATNATLAWLGGGSLAAGGGGVALGTTILGGIVAGPALAIFGHIMGNKGKTALNIAQSNLEEVKTIEAEAELVVSKLIAVYEIVDLANTTLSNVSCLLRREVRKLSDVLETQGEDFSKFDQSAKDVVFKTVKYAQLIKAIIDTPILDVDGQLVLSTQKALEEVKQAIEL